MEDKNLTMKNKNLHDLFDKLGLEKVTEFANYDKKDVKLGGEIVLNIFAVYSLEKNIDVAKVKFKTAVLTELFNQFVMCAALYVNLCKGLMKLKGRLSLTDDKATFQMTAKGNSYVLNMRNEKV